MLQITGLSKRYGDLVAVDDVSLAVPRGRIVGFVGPNGAGKSTTMRSVFGLVAPDTGTITWDGTPVDAVSRSAFGYMPEQRGLYPKMRIGDQVSYFAELKGVPRPLARRRAEEILDSLGLGDRLRDPLEKLSHGNQQRVQLAVSLATDPELLVLDEPFNGLDPVAVDVLRDVLRERVRAGAGVLFSSHQLDLVERVCDEVVVIVRGRVRAAGTVTDVRSATGRHHLTIEVDRPTTPLPDVIDGPHLAASTRSVTLAVTDDQQLEHVLARARSVGTVTRFDFDLPTLQEAFTAIAGAPIDAAHDDAEVAA